MFTKWLKERFKDADNARTTISVASGALSVVALLMVLTAYLLV